MPSITLYSRIIIFGIILESALAKRKTMKKKFLYSGLALLTLINFSCDKNTMEEDGVVPQMKLALDRSFMYHDIHELKAASYTTDDLQTAFLIENESLTVYMDSGTDGVSFRISEAKLLSGYVGEYTLQTLPNPDNGDANTTYVYKNGATSGSVYFSQANYINGSIEITDYNEKYNLISGTFEMTMEDVPDPTLTTATPTPRRCDVTITGNFENARLITNP